MTASMQIPADDPLSLAWVAYKKTQEYSLIREAMFNGDRTMPHGHADGLLWTAFLAGRTAALGIPVVQRLVSPGEIAYQLTKRLVIDMPTARAAIDAAIATPTAAAEPVPDSVWEALQRMIEDGLNKGPASRDDALAVSRHRDRVRFLMGIGS